MPQSLRIPESAAPTPPRRPVLDWLSRRSAVRWLSKRSGVRWLSRRGGVRWLIRRGAGVALIFLIVLANLAINRAARDLMFSNMTLFTFL
ncbi:hypothetical protein JYU34_009151 [Plutella xylostella]|uniref:ABC transporter permease n=1 Tax=Plutella xylostella TaxID=51655 RepID=A0ABQ7QNA2_PLUXY|nr:hypothetical protein JYU34_009151 [Plutella xylostella]